MITKRNQPTHDGTQSDFPTQLPIWIKWTCAGINRISRMTMPIAAYFLIAGENKANPKAISAIPLIALSHSGNGKKEGISG